MPKKCIFVPLLGHLEYAGFILNAEWNDGTDIADHVVTGRCCFIVGSVALGVAVVVHCVNALIGAGGFGNDSCDVYLFLAK